MSLLNVPTRISFLAIALAATSLPAGCAHDDKKPPHLSTDKPKWYQSDMDAQDRAFFLGSFLNGSSH